MNRVVITGLGVITPIGNNVEEFWNGILEEKVGIEPICTFDATEYKAKLSANVKNFNARDYMDFKLAKRMDRFSQFAVAAAKEALEDSGLCLEQEDKYRCGICVGSGVGSLMGIEREYDKMLKSGPFKIHPLTAPLVLGNMAAANIAIFLDFKENVLMW